MWVETTFSVSCILRPWQITTNDRLFGSTTVVTFDVVIHPPVSVWVFGVIPMFSMHNSISIYVCVCVCELLLLLRFCHSIDGAWCEKSAHENCEKQTIVNISSVLF